MTTPNPDPEEVREALAYRVDRDTLRLVPDIVHEEVVEHFKVISDAARAWLAQQDGGMRVTVYGGTAADHIWTQMRFDADCVVNGEFVKAGTLYRMIAASEGAE